MDEKRLHDGFPLGFIEKKTFGRVYMRTVEAEFRSKHPGRDFDDTLSETCGLSCIYLEGDEDFFYLGDFIRKMGLDEQAVRAECGRASSMKRRYGTGSRKNFGATNCASLPPATRTSRKTRLCSSEIGRAHV